MLDRDRLGTRDVGARPATPHAGTSSTASPHVATSSSGDEDVPVVGERLRAARVGAGMTLEQVSAATRIRVPVLRELEDDHLGSAGNAVYTRGHIRAIAAAVGTDPGPLVRAFDARVGAAAPSAIVVPDTVPAPRLPTNGLSVPVAAPPERSSPRWLTASLAGLVVLVSLLAIGTFGDGSDGDTEPDRAAPTPRAVATAPPPQAAEQPASEAAASLVLEATGRSWISVRNRGDFTLFEGPVDAGWTRRFDDPAAVTVRLGNAAAVRASCGGGAASPQGADGVAVTVRCTPQGLQRP